MTGCSTSSHNAGRAQDLAEEVEREKGARESAAKTAKEKLKAAESTEKKAATAEKNRALAESKSTELLAKQNETDVKLAEAISLNTSQAEELNDLRAALEACEQKWYNEGFADAEQSAEASSSVRSKSPTRLKPYRYKEFLRTEASSSVRSISPTRLTPYHYKKFLKTETLSSVRPNR